MHFNTETGKIRLGQTQFLPFVYWFARDLAPLVCKNAYTSDYGVINKPVLRMDAKEYLMPLLEGGDKVSAIVLSYFLPFIFSEGDEPEPFRER